MILFTTPKLRRLGIFMVNDSWAICIDGLLGDFDIPNTACEIQFIAHNRPAKDRLEIDYSKDRLFPVRVNGVGRPVFQAVRHDIKQLVDKHGKLYVECWYED